MSDFCRRLNALLNKEMKQLLRDNSSMLIGIVIPLMLLFLMGFGLSMDIKHLPTAVVMEDSSATVQQMTSFLKGSEYFDPTYVRSMHEAEQLMLNRKVDAILRIPPDFTEKLYRNEAQVQVIIYGVETSATSAKGYLQAGIMQWVSQNAGKFANGTGGTGKGQIAVQSRVWFNDANTSTWYFVPGIIIMVVTLVGVFMTSLVMAKEWERGTLESLFVTPVRVLELVLSKMLPYFLVAFVGLVLCLLSARFVFQVPIHGSLFMIVLVSVIYLFVTLGMGLTISSTIKSQFVACQMALSVSMLPTMMLSGFIYDLRSVPKIVSAIGHVLPATYYLQTLKSLFLAGNNWPMLIKNTLVLTAYAIFFVGLSFYVTRKKVE